MEDISNIIVLMLIIIINHDGFYQLQKKTYFLPLS